MGSRRRATGLRGVSAPEEGRGESGQRYGLPGVTQFIEIGRKPGQNHSKEPEGSGQDERKAGHGRRQREKRYRRQTEESGPSPDVKCGGHCSSIIRGKAAGANILLLGGAMAASRWRIAAGLQRLYAGRGMRPAPRKLSSEEAVYNAALRALGRHAYSVFQMRTYLERRSEDAGLARRSGGPTATRKVD